MIPVKHFSSRTSSMASLPFPCRVLHDQYNTPLLGPAEAGIIVDRMQEVLIRSTTLKKPRLQGKVTL